MGSISPVQAAQRPGSDRYALFQSRQRPTNEGETDCTYDTDSGGIGPEHGRVIPSSEQSAPTYPECASSEGPSKCAHGNENDDQSDSADQGSGHSPGLGDT